MHRATKKGHHTVQEIVKDSVSETSSNKTFRNPSCFPGQHFRTVATLRPDCFFFGWKFGTIYESWTWSGRSRTAFCNSLCFVVFVLFFFIFTQQFLARVAQRRYFKICNGDVFLPLKHGSQVCNDLSRSAPTDLQLQLPGWKQEKKGNGSLRLMQYAHTPQPACPSCSGRHNMCASCKRSQKFNIASGTFARRVSGETQKTEVQHVLVI